MPLFAGDRLAAGLVMPGVILLRPTLSFADALDELAAIAGASAADEWDEQIAYLPLH